MRICFVHDIKGWAFYNRSMILKKYLSDQYEIDVMHYSSYRDKNHDLIITFSPGCIPRNVNLNKVVFGISSHKNIDKLNNVKFAFTNDKNIFSKLKSKNKFYVPNGVDTQLFSSDIERNLIENRINVGLVGSKSRYQHKGGDRIDVICKKLRESGYPVNNKKFFVNSVNPKEIITQEKMRDYYMGIDVLVISSVSETGPNPLLEAMSMGVPVIANRVGLVDEIIVDNVNGLIVGGYNKINQYVDKIKFIKNSPKTYKLLSTEAKNTMKGWDWKKRSIGYKKMINEILLIKK